MDEGHSADEFLIGAGRKRAAAAKKNVVKTKVAKPVRKAGRVKETEGKVEPAAAA